PPPEIQQASEAQLARFEILSHDRFSPEQTLRSRLVDVAAFIQPGDPPSVELLADSSQAASLGARRILVERIQWLKLNQAESAVEALAPELSTGAPTVSLRTIGTQSGGSALATLVPLILV